jgi:hypothetical protein
VITELSVCLALHFSSSRLVQGYPPECLQIPFPFRRLTVTVTLQRRANCVYDLCLCYYPQHKPKDKRSRSATTVTTTSRRGRRTTAAAPSTADNEVYKRQRPTSKFYEPTVSHPHYYCVPNCYYRREVRLQGVLRTNETIDCVATKTAAAPTRLQATKPTTVSGVSLSTSITSSRTKQVKRVNEAQRRNERRRNSKK